MVFEDRGKGVRLTDLVRSFGILRDVFKWRPSEKLETGLKKSLDPLLKCWTSFVDDPKIFRISYVLWKIIEIFLNFYI